MFPQKARLMTGVRPCGAVEGPGLGPCWCEMGSRGRGGGGEGEGQAGVPALVLGGCCWPQGWAEPHTCFGGSPLCLGADPGQCPRTVAHRRPQQPRLCAVPPAPLWEHAWPHEAGLLETPLGSAYGDTGPSRQRLGLFFKSANSSCDKLRAGSSSGETLNPFQSRMGSVSRQGVSSVPGRERGPSRSW